MKNITQSLKIVTLAIVLSFGLSYVYAWTAPTLPPPAGNVSAPINTSTTSQVKGAGGVGGLGIEGLLRGYSNAIFDGQVGIGTASPSNKLDIGNNAIGQIGGANTVVVTVSTSTGRSFLSLGKDANNRAQFGWNNTDEINLTGSWYADLTTVQAGNQPLVLQRSGGNVGVGTTAPGAKLDVAGGIQATGDICTTASGGKCLSGSGATDVYSSEIIDGAAGGVYSTYCRITKNNGLVECKIASDWNMTSFGALITPFTATTPGSYSLSCQQGIAGAAWPACCRTNNTTGATECRRSNTWTLATPWIVVASPF